MMSTDTALEKKPLTLPAHTPIPVAIAAMTQAGTTCVLVLEQQQLTGIFTERDVVRAISQQTEFEQLQLADLMTRNVISLKSHQIGDIASLSRLFSQNRIRHLPVVNHENQLEGLITPQSLRNLLKPEYLLRYIRVAEVMNRHVITGFPDENLQTLITRMTQHQVSCVVILHPLLHHPVGIITERDVVRFSWRHQDFEQIFAHEIMTSPLLSMQPHDSLWLVHQRMSQHGIRRLVITDAQGQLAGIITQTQILKLVDPLEMYQVMQQMQIVIDQQTQELQRLNNALASANRELQRLATTDELTQVANRRHFNEHIQRLWRQNRPLSLLLCDIDDFKPYNDHYGHPAGDDCLVAIAQILRDVLNHHEDLVCRYGGEEFALILPTADFAMATTIAQTLLQRLKDVALPHHVGSHGYLTLSMGVTSTHHQPQLIREAGPHQLIQFADQLLYESKQRGRNTYTAREFFLD